MSLYRISVAGSVAFIAHTFLHLVLPLTVLVEWAVVGVIALFAFKRGSHDTSVP